MRHIIIDIGNTVAKMAIYDGRRRVTDIEYAGHDDMARKAGELCIEHQARSGMYSSVIGDDSAIEGMRSQGIEMRRLTASAKLPFEIGYKTPQTLGSDRIAAVAGAVSEFGGRDILIVDAGTAITYEYVTADGLYRGGNISPGIRTRFRALNAFTGKLPLVGEEDYEEVIGTSTRSAIAAGVINGVVHEINGVIEEFAGQHPQNAIILTGGDHKSLVLKVKYCIFARPELVLDGIAVISDMQE